MMIVLLSVGQESRYILLQPRFSLLGAGAFNLINTVKLWSLKSIVISIPYQNLVSEWLMSGAMLISHLRRDIYNYRCDRHSW